MADIESIRQVAQARTPFSAWFGVVLLFALFGIIVLAVIGPSPRGDTYEQKRAKAREEKLKAAREEDAKALTTYAWIDKNKGVARIPIERAMDLTVTELARKKPAPAGPIAAPEQPTVAATGAAVPSPAATTSPSPSGTPKPTSVAGPSSEAHNQPAAAINPAPAPPATQPGASASPAASPAHAAAQPNPAKSPQQTPVQSAPGSPLPVRGKETPTATPR
ncbi:MAG: hypothetical protein QOI22_1507 [Verrucomicrobiota bacterium]